MASSSLRKASKNWPPFSGVTSARKRPRCFSAWSLFRPRSDQSSCKASDKAGKKPRAWHRGWPKASGTCSRTFVTIRGISQTKALASTCGDSAAATECVASLGNHCCREYQFHQGHSSFSSCCRSLWQRPFHPALPLPDLPLPLQPVPLACSPSEGKLTTSKACAISLGLASGASLGGRASGSVGAWGRLTSSRRSTILPVLLAMSTPLAA